MEFGDVLRHHQYTSRHLFTRFQRNEVRLEYGVLPAIEGQFVRMGDWLELGQTLLVPLAFQRPKDGGNMFIEEVPALEAAQVQGHLVEPAVMTALIENNDRVGLTVRDQMHEVSLALEALGHSGPLRRTLRGVLLLFVWRIAHFLFLILVLERDYF